MADRCALPQIGSHSELNQTYPNVNFGPSVFLAEEDFGRGVGRRSAPGVQLVLR